jgi:hypothetical protein
MGVGTIHQDFLDSLVVNEMIMSIFRTMVYGVYGVLQLQLVQLGYELNNYSIQVTNKTNTFTTKSMTNKKTSLNLIKEVFKI